MEFPNLGKNCAWSECKALDFLPFTCSYCGLVFCKDHSNIVSHGCKSVANTNSEGGAAMKTFICSTEECNSSSSVAMLCPKCEKHFCLTHRYHTCFNTSEEELQKKLEIWNAPRQQFSESVKEVHNIVNEGIKKAKQNPKKKATALKVQLMRLKGKAEGPKSIPSTHRIYFLILFPLSSKRGKSKAVFVSKEWSVGRIIDAVASVCDISNKNNEMNAAKLRLFRHDDGSQLSSDISVKLEDLITSGTISDGETLICEYVSPTENLSDFILTNSLDYKEV